VRENSSYCLRVLHHWARRGSIVVLGARLKASPIVFKGHALFIHPLPEIVVAASPKIDFDLELV
jgi:hypothetical protein